METSEMPYDSPTLMRVFRRGYAQGVVIALLVVLDARGVEVSDAVLQRLEMWVRRAVTATNPRDLEG
jgi:hypothetical protein